MFKRLWLPILVWMALFPVFSGQSEARAALTAQGSFTADQARSFIDQYCTGCHGNALPFADLDLQSLDLTDVGEHGEILETVVMKLRGGAMPPTGMPRADQAAIDSMVGWLEASLDQVAAADPDPGRPGLYRLNRTEYANVIREMFALDIDIAEFLPPDDTSFGFDNIADILGISPALLEGYLSAADAVSAVVVGDPDIVPTERIYPVSAYYSQEYHVEGLPLGTRGGTLIEYTAPLDAVYEIATFFNINSTEAPKGLQYPYQFEVLVDGARVKSVRIGGQADYFTMMQNARRSINQLDSRTRVRIPLTAGVHQIGVTFVEKTAALEPAHLQPLRSNFDPVDLGGIPGVQRVSISGPFDGTTPAEATPFRRAVFTCEPAAESEELDCAREIFRRLARQGYRRPVTDEDVGVLMSFFEQGRRDKGTFEGGVQFGLRRLLASPEFMFRIERDPEDIAPGTPYRVSDLELASRLSFFLWSGIPDDELIDLADAGRLSDSIVLEEQVRRMMDDPRSLALVENFAGQWLYLRNLQSATPDAEAFPFFDGNVLDAFRTETEMFFESIMREDRNVVDLLTADYTFVNDRLAKHYGISNVYGSNFRRVDVTDETRRGLLGHGSVLTVTSLAHRTSPVVRGKWILENVLGTPPPAPPDEVPALDENDPLSLDAESMRARLERHRNNPACSGCHSLMDPIGFALENFDAVGAWRDLSESGEPIDSSGQLAGGTPIDGVVGLRDAITARPEQFVQTMAERMLTYAMGRGVEYYDVPAIRSIVREAANNDYRFSSIVMGVVRSPQFQMKRKALPEDGEAEPIASR